MNTIEYSTHVGAGEEGRIQPAPAGLHPGALAAEMDLHFTARRVPSNVRTIAAVVLTLGILSARAQQNLPGPIPCANPSTAGAWSARASLDLKEVYDSDIYMQSVTALANQPSFVTIVTPVLGAQWKPRPEFSLSLNYSPDIAYYESASGENNITHRGALNLGGSIQDTKWELLGGFVWIDGNHQNSHHENSVHRSH